MFLKRSTFILYVIFNEIIQIEMHLKVEYLAFPVKKNFLFRYSIESKRSFC
ncbi:hypothetical protein IGJ02_001114 [Enterococcus sp. DIV0724b]